MPGCAVLHYVTRLTPEQQEAHMQGLIAQADAWFAEQEANARAKALADFAERERIGGEQ